ncbi:hypothetical protein CCP2SC5_380016 [Azospirillaceae bacterium]
MWRRLRRNFLGGLWMTRVLQFIVSPEPRAPLALKNWRRCVRKLNVELLSGVWMKCLRSGPYFGYYSKKLSLQSDVFMNMTLRKRIPRDAQKKIINETGPGIVFLVLEEEA